MNILPLSWRRSIRSFFTAGLLLTGSSAFADDFEVNNPLDFGEGNLRQAINDANNAGPGTHNINFVGAAANTTNVLGSSLPTINVNVNINGTGADKLIINGSSVSRVFFVNSGNVKISNLTITSADTIGGTGGSASGNGTGGGGGGLGAGAGLFVNQNATVTLTNVPITNNRAVGGQGGTYVAGSPGAGAGGGGLSGSGGTATSQGGGGGGGLYGTGGNGGAPGAGTSRAGGGGGGSGGTGGDGGEGSGGVPDAGGGGGGGTTGTGGAGGSNGGGGSVGGFSQGGGGGGSGGAAGSAGAAGNSGAGAGGSSSPGGGGSGGGGGGIGGTNGANGGGGSPGSGGNGAANGGGGGAGGGYSSSNGANGGSGGANGGGGGGSAVGAGGSSGGLGGTGGDLGGGGGGGKGNTNGGAGGAGGHGGGGGGGGNGTTNGAGGNGGFGAGGGASTSTAGTGGTFGGNGGTTGGGGGAGLGGAVYVREGGTLIVNGTTVSGNSVVGGSGAGNGQNGSTAGSGYYLDNTVATFVAGVSTLSDDFAGRGNAALNVTGGTLIMNGNASIPVNVTGGRLQGNGSLGNTAVNGTIAPGNSIGTLTVNGSYLQNAGSIYEVELNSSGQSDLVRVNGAAQINGGIINVLAANGNYSIGQKWTILTATGGVSGRYSSVQDNLALFDFRDVYTANTVMLETFVASSSSASQITPLTFNQASFLNYLSGISGSATGDLSYVIGQLLTLPNDQALHALDQMSGVQTANLLTLARLRSLFLNQTLADEIRAGLGITNGSVRAQAGDDDSAGSFGCGWRPWGRFYGLEGAVNGDANSAGFNYQFTGFQVGLEREAWQGGKFGVSGGYVHTIADSERVYGHASSEGLLIGAYGSQTVGRAYAFGAATYGFNHYTASRGISFAGVNRIATGSPEQHEFNALVEAGYNLNAGPVLIRPLVGLHYLRLNQEGFTETGANALNLVMSSQKTQALWGSLGFRAGMPLRSEALTITPNVHARWLNDWNGEDRFVAGSLSGVGGSYLVQGASAGRNYLVTGAGVSFDNGGRLRVVGDYTYQTSGKQASHTGSGAVEVRW